LGQIAVAAAPNLRIDQTLLQFCREVEHTASTFNPPISILGNGTCNIVFAIQKRNLKSL
jgi:hypothetical protein